tara:strand:- start:3276 stop:3479 length:204 start_codon:yes stop_codon:yes gene_type:complete
MLTLNDVHDILTKIDEVTLLEILDISSEEIVDRFGDLIETRYERLAKDLAADRRQLCLFDEENNVDV